MARQPWSVRLYGKVENNGHQEKELPHFLDGMGKRLLILISQSVTRRICPILDVCFTGKDYELHYKVSKANAVKIRSTGWSLWQKSFAALRLCVSAVKSWIPPAGSPLYGSLEK